MPSKRKGLPKKPAKSPGEASQKPVVTQVVEVVEETTSGSSVAPEDSIKKDEVKEVVDELKDEVSDVEEKVTELSEKVEPSEPLPKSEEGEKEPEKDVIEELFDKREPTVAPEISGYKEGGSKSMLVWVLVVIGVALLTGIGLLFIVQGSSSITSIFSKPTPTPTQTPSPTPKPASAVKKEDLKIQVLNGSGKTGAGAAMKSFLEDKGYTVSNVGNAATSDYEQTEIVVKKGNEDALSLIKDDIDSDYTVGTAEASLSEDSLYDVRITIGKE